jgi:hypothetical protein
LGDLLYLRTVSDHGGVMTTRLAKYENVVLTASGGNAGLGNGYFVTVYRPGGVASATATSTTITMDEPHGFAVNDWTIQKKDGAWNATTFAKVSGVSGNDVTFGSTITATAGDEFVNLGTDTGTTGPSYDGSDTTVYSDSDGVTAISNSQITCDGSGRFKFWHTNSKQYDLFVRDSSGSPQQLVQRALHQLPQSSSVPATPDEGFEYVVDEGAATRNTKHISLTDEDDAVNWQQ